MSLTILAHAYGLALTQTAGLTRPSVVFGYAALILQQALKLR